MTENTPPLLQKEHCMIGFSIPSRVIGALAVVGMVMACGGREVPVRGAPQPVHPSPSALAQSPAYTPGATTAAPYAPSANDGSQPIID